MDEENYEEAMKVADEGKGSFLLKTKKLEIFYEQKRFDEVKQLLEQLHKDSGRNKKESETSLFTVELITAQIDLKEQRVQSAT